MDFTEIFKHTGICKWSPNGRYFATAVDYRLTIRDSETLKLVQVFTCLDQILDIDWSFDSKYILCALYKRSMVQVKSVENADWYCKITDPAAKIVSARWAPDGRHIITAADFQIRLSAWSLVNKSCTHIKFPKYPNQGISFTRDGRWMALAIRKDCKDHVQVLSTESWDLVKQFAVDSSDLADLAWSPDGHYICVWDSCLEYKVLVYLPDGKIILKYQAYENSLGVRCVSWAPGGQFIAIGSYDQKVRLLNTITWKAMVDLSHQTLISSGKAVVYVEEVQQQTPQGGPKTRYIIAVQPCTIPSTKPDTGKPNPKMGISSVVWSFDSKFLYSRNENMPNVVWIWEVANLRLQSVLVHTNPVKAVEWDPIRPRLAVCTGTPALFVWNPASASVIDVPTGTLNISGLSWNPDGTSLLLKDKDRMCCAFVLSQ
mmetsp:Transcript_6052/g.10416  ORF Transcript_6052/g.10416 Transcript_6052/m.10416 type:complete len:429 (-) Transcript_6052:100-1386(-)|eukprot:CAMPEP_0196656610 /NCGR_PEP_ID=MMETSP1086-20130531/18779_1 /TAXON_ID=77921 /ORGANISM="Cyanoptyche  gloeocystis , Strain SAG4.97" /LENGTH=428 /DNA_ID=CAMNT_0041989439 /DNA_START=37 /DNA_END=1323 /DNA_ORIENTATION=-